MEAKLAKRTAEWRTQSELGAARLAGRALGGEATPRRAAQCGAQPGEWKAAAHVMRLLQCAVALPPAQSVHTSQCTSGAHSMPSDSKPGPCMHAVGIN